MKPQIKELSVRLDGWIEKVKSVGESLQEEIPTLATMAWTGARDRVCFFYS